MDDLVYRTRYVDLVEETVENVFYPKRMTSIYKEAHELIQPYVTGTSGENCASKLGMKTLKTTVLKKSCSEAKALLYLLNRPDGFSTIYLMGSALIG